MKKLIIGSLAALGGLAIVSGVVAVIETVKAKKRYEKMPEEDKAYIMELARELTMAYIVGNKHIDEAEQANCSEKENQTEESVDSPKECAQPEEN